MENGKQKCYKGKRGIKWLSGKNVNNMLTGKRDIKMLKWEKGKIVKMEKGK